MLTNHVRYKRGLERWAFEITNEAGQYVGVVPFADALIKGR